MSKFWSTLWLKLKPVLGLMIWASVVLWLVWLLADKPINPNNQAWWWHIK